MKSHVDSSPTTRQASAAPAPRADSSDSFSDDESPNALTEMIQISRGLAAQNHTLLEVFTLLSGLVTALGCALEKHPQSYCRLAPKIKAATAEINQLMHPNG